MLRQQWNIKAMVAVTKILDHLGKVSQAIEGNRIDQPLFIADQRVTERCFQTLLRRQHNGST